MLMKYVTEVDVSIVDTFERTVAPDVAEAMRATTTTLLGQLHGDYFEMHIVTLADNMKQLMHQFIMTGYMYRHIAHKLELQHSLRQRALPASALQDSLPQDLRASERRGPASLDFDGFAPVRRPLCPLQLASCASAAVALFRGAIAAARSAGLLSCG